MENRKYPTLADIEAGNVEAGELAEYAGQMKRMADAAQSAMGAVRPMKDEAKLVFDRLFDLGLPEIEEYIATNPPSPGAIAFLIFESIARYKTDRARKNAAKSNAATTEAMSFVLSEWAAHKDAYEGNKSEFARVYSARIKREKGIDITDRTIRERWLR